MNLVQDYNPEWPSWFQKIKFLIESRLDGIPHTIEHVGSTSIPSMTAKPVIDVDIVVEEQKFPVVKERLAKLGYFHQGDLGFPGRDAFDLRNLRHEIGEIIVMPAQVAVSYTSIHEELKASVEFNCR
jgi:GrpB-like predicted nucleotidyltransferase (UPF0157 family)